MVLLLLRPPLSLQHSLLYLPWPQLLRLLVCLHLQQLQPRPCAVVVAARPPLQGKRATRGEGGGEVQNKVAEGGVQGWGGAHGWVGAWTAGRDGRGVLLARLVESRLSLLGWGWIGFVSWFGCWVWFWRVRMGEGGLGVACVAGAGAEAWHSARGGGVC